jgi:predicted porin
MKRSLILASLAIATTGSAFAQSSVTVWGRLNQSVERIKVNGVSSKEIVDNSSRLGFRGVEDLGGGLKAGFAIEHGFDASTGQSSWGNQFWGRGSEVFLSSNMGTLRIGNFTSEAYYATADYVSWHNHDTGTSSDALYAYLPANTNKVAYRTPEFSGLTAEIAVSEQQAGMTDRGYDVAVNYNLGALSLGGGYQDSGDANQFALRANYTLGAFTFGGYYQRDEDGFGTGLGDRNNFRLAGMYAMGASEFHLNFGMADDYSNIVGDSGATQATVAYGYNLSKRTRVYAFYTKVDADAASPYNDLSSVAVGLRHNF